MISYGLIGFILGFLAGMGINAYLLQGVPRGEFQRNKSMRLRYGGLNWAIAILGMIIGIALQETR